MYALGNGVGTRRMAGFAKSATDLYRWEGEVTSLTPGTGSTVRAAWFPT